MGQRFHGNFTNTDVDALETLAEIRIPAEAETLWVQFLVATADLTDFDVAYRLHPSAGYFSIATVAADFTTPEGPVLGASGDLGVAAAGATVHWLRLDVRGVDQVRLQAAGANTVVTGYYGGY